MKSSMILLAVCLLALSVIGGPALAGEHVVNAPIGRVTVYSDRALVVRTVELDLQAGEQSIKVENLLQYLDPTSLRASVSGVPGIAMLGLTHESVHHTEAIQSKTAEFDRLIEEMELVTIKAVEDRRDVLTAQKKLLTSIGEAATREMGDDIAKGGLQIQQWEGAYSFVGQHLTAVTDSLRLVGVELRALTKQLDKLKAERSQAGANVTNMSVTAQADLRLEQPGKLTLELEYVVGGASWVPVYTARLNQNGDTTAFGYHAMVQQETGEDWDDVRLTLSTARLSHGTGPDTPEPWVLRVYDVPQVLARTKGGAQYAPSQGYSSSQSVQNVDALLEHVAGIETDTEGEVIVRGGRAAEVAYMVDGVPITAALSQNAYTTSFEIQRRETIPSGDRTVRTTIAEYRLPVVTEFVCRPKISEGVYRQVTLTNSSDALLIPGEVAISTMNDFVGSGYINRVINAGDTCKLMFGLDDAFTVKRRVLDREKDANNTSFWGGDAGTKVRQTVEIKLTNTGRRARTVIVEEALPISQDKRVKVKFGDIVPKPAFETESENVATWRVLIPAGGETTIVVPYKIEYPDDVAVAGF
ncbi:MAG: mucoidy inhibitor MuiA family protein [candidate division Zixibacteria bacterium]|nr:mucoidy inhibitor MuiA family protein [candidate division Zixibacteria bacterium]